MYMHPCAWRVHGVCMACACAFGSRTWHAQLATEVLGEFGGGGGLRVAFRTRAVAAGRALPGEVVTVWLRGEVLAEVWLTEAEAEAEAAGVGVGVGVGGAAARIRTEAWQQVEVEVEVETRAAEGGGASASASAGLVVTLGGVRLFGERPLPLPDWRPVAGWRIGLGARCGEPNPSPSPDFNPNPHAHPSPNPRCGEGDDRHLVRSLLVESGLRLRAGALPLQVSRNGQDYDAGGVHLLYHAQPAMLPRYGPADGGTLLSLNVSGVPAAAAAPAVFAATSAALCRFNSSGQSVTTAATLTEAGHTARCLTPPAFDLSSTALDANVFENATATFETTVHLALNGAAPRPPPAARRPPPTAPTPTSHHPTPQRPPPTSHHPTPTAQRAPPTARRPPPRRLAPLLTRAAPAHRGGLWCGAQLHLLRPPTHPPRLPLRRSERRARARARREPQPARLERVRRGLLRRRHRHPALQLRGCRGACQCGGGRGRRAAQPAAMHLSRPGRARPRAAGRVAQRPGVHQRDGVVEPQP